MGGGKTVKPTYTQPHAQPGHEGNPPRLRKVRDRDGDGKRIVVAVYRADRWQSLLDQGHLTQIQCEAAQQFEGTWQTAQLQSYGLSGTGIIAGTPGHAHPSDTKLDALQKISHAIKFLEQRLGKGAHGVLMLMVSTPATYSGIARSLRVSRAKISVRVRDCLSVLAEHYGYG